MKTLFSKFLRPIIFFLMIKVSFTTAFAQPAVDPIAPLPRALMPAVTLATLPAGNFLENIWVDDDNSLLITNYLTKEIIRWRATTGMTVEGKIDGHPVSISKDSD